MQTIVARAFCVRYLSTYVIDRQSNTAPLPTGVDKTSQRRGGGTTTLSYTLCHACPKPSNNSYNVYQLHCGPRRSGRSHGRRNTRYGASVGSGLVGTGSATGPPPPAVAPAPSPPAVTAPAPSPPWKRGANINQHTAVQRKNNSERTMILRLQQ